MRHCSCFSGLRFPNPGNSGHTHRSPAERQTRLHLPGRPLPRQGGRKSSPCPVRKRPCPICLQQNRAEPCGAARSFPHRTNACAPSWKHRVCALRPHPHALQQLRASQGKQRGRLPSSAQEEQGIEVKARRTVRCDAMQACPY